MECSPMMTHGAEIKAFSDVDNLMYAKDPVALQVENTIEN